MASGLKNKLKRSYSVIKKELYKKDVSEWLYDNFYLIDRHYRFSISDKKALKCDLLYETLKRFCEDCNYSLTPKSLSSHLSGLKQKFGFYELSSLKNLLSICAINKIAEMLFARKGISNTLPKIIKLLYSLSDPEFDDIIPKVWECEELLIELEPEYKNYEPETKTQYRSLISSYAFENLTSEKKAIETLSQNAKKKNTTIGNLLFRPKKRYLVAWGLLWGLLFASLMMLSFFTVGAITLLFAVPFGIACSSICDHILSFFAPAYRTPRIKLESVPKNAKTLVTVASLMTGSKSDERVFESLARFRYMNPDDNIYFCLLADLPDSEKQEEDGDSEIIESAKRNIDKLNSLHGNRFCLFFRNRVMNESENRFGGWERKRGAVCNLVSYIRNGGESGYYGGDFIKEIKYILTLDSDTNLSVGSVREMLSIALHPINRPIAKKGRVVSGYGIIQPSVRTELASAYKTGFSRLISGVGGVDVYATASFTRAQSLLGSGSFCGKGLIDVELFDSLVVDKLPNGLVLSHDVIEGSIMRTLCASDIVLTDSTPGNTVSFFRRLHRWIRGDFQNLYFLKSKSLDFLSKSRILLTVLRHSSPIFSLLAITVGSFLTDTNGFFVFFFAYSEFFLPCILSVGGFLFSGKHFAVKRFFSKAYSMLTQTFIRLLFELSSSCRKAILTEHAFLLASVRLVTRKKTLEWVTAAQTEKLSASLGKYVVDSAYSVLTGILIMIFAKSPFIKFAGLLYFVYPLISLILSKNIDGGAELKARLSENQKKFLSAHISDMFAFYSDNVNETTNHLPPDNIQLSPVSATAYRTSPTNIGFYLVSLLTARDMKIISTKELAERLSKSIDTIEKLPKYHGNLYNWYDIKTLAVIGNNYVSSVDSGNFVVMLVVLKEGILEYANEDDRLENIAKRIEKIINETDVTVFYDKRRSLFRIGLADTPDGVKLDSNCYDLLMSEARMLGYYAVATSNVPKKHWQSLSRTLTHHSGYIGMMSWSGTAFEYLMPHLFLPLYRDSFLFESVAFALMVQRSALTPWGVSESGFYSFDSDMNYQYKANGLKILALRRVGNDEKIVSPYSTYLSLSVCPDSAIKNIFAFENKGMYGKYGLYEALDMNNDKNGLSVKSYMAHHVGMSIIGCANAINDNIFVRRFMRDMRMYSANELLQEKIPIDAHIFSDEHSSQKGTKRPIYNSHERKEKVDIDSPSVKLLSNGDMTALISSSGHIGLCRGERKLAHTEFQKYSFRFSPCVVFSRDNKNYGCVPIINRNNEYGFEHGNGFASHIASGKEFSGRVKYSMSKNGNCFIVNTRAESLKKYDITFSFEPMLETEKKYLSHISFSRLFIESEYDQTKRILYFHRRSSLDGRYIFTLAIAPKEKDMKLSFLTNRENIPASSVETPFDYANVETDNKVGPCIDPLCLVRANDAEGGRATFLITCGETKTECERNIRLARSDKTDYRPKTEEGMVEKMLPMILYGREGIAVSRFTNCDIGSLWSRGISGDYPLCLISISELAITRTKAVLNAFSSLSKVCIRCELIFLVSEEDNYNRPVEKSILECLAETDMEKYLGRNGGIFILRENETEKDLITALSNTASYILDFSNSIEHKRETAKPDRAEIITKPQKTAKLIPPDDAIESGNGYFIPEGYVVDKSRLPDAPYSFVLSGYRFSTVVTQSSLGYTFFDNARERRICSFYGDSRSLDDGERIFLVADGKKYDLCAISNKVIYKKGEAIYYGEADGVEYSLSVVIPPKYPVKLMRIKLSKNENRTLSFGIKPVMGDSVRNVGGIETVPFSENGNEFFVFRNVFGMTFPEGRGFAGVHGGKIDTDTTTVTANGNDVLFFLGACTTESGAKKIASMVDKRFFDTAKTESESFVESFLPRIKITTKSKTNDMLFDFFLPYQTSICRFFARGSFYQSGGAYGFRDQLQDSLSILFSSPETVRRHIIRCAAHQYEDGSVMHWWHTRNYGGVNRGIKSKCSDDLLYLPIVVADYIEKTEDESILALPVHYLTSEPLGDHNERYEQPEKSATKESIFLHCLRALSRADRRGKNGMLLMGSCDWNDGFSLVGEKGIGESVFSTLLYIVAIEKFLPICEKYGDSETVNHYKKVKEELKNIVEEKAFYGDRYARAICDDGTILGIESCEECKIDILSQAFSAIANLDEERTKKALDCAFSNLYDGKEKIFKLFSPPFANGKTRVGYIRGYVAGIRENGGQYTHGALWGALGCFKAGLDEEGLLILDCANPATHNSTKELSRKYKTEPYAVSADIYSGEFVGRGGWSWYTGASGWYYRIMLEYVLGLKLGKNKILSALPIIEYEALMELGEAKLKIIASDKTKTPLFDGVEVNFSLSIQNGDHILELPLKKE